MIRNSRPAYFIYAVLLFCISLNASTAHASTSLDNCNTAVDTASGEVVGIPSGQSCAYKGIAYAQPPVGDLRWAPTQRPIRSANKIVASQFGNVCPQALKGSEDCLYLNIWKPREKQSSNAPFPVMLWIHGGANIVGSGSEPMYEGKNLAVGEDVIVVTFNYRLGIFGFYGHEELTNNQVRSTGYFSEESVKDARGNYGLMDQISALKWVKENIQQFGGDPDNITLFGESAGAWAICHMLTSPEAEGLFHKAILQSQGCGFVASAEQATFNTERLTKAAGCDIAENPAACMLEKSMFDLLLTTRTTPLGVDFNNIELGNNDALFPFRSYVDGKVLPTLPKQALKAGQFHNVPVLGGLVEYESALFNPTLPYALGDLFGWHRQRALDEILPQFDISIGAVESVYSSSRYGYGVLGSYNKINDLWGDYVIGCPTIQALKDISAYQPDSTYNYRFSYDGSTKARLLFGGKTPTHGMDMQFVFGTLDKPISILFDLFPVYFYWFDEVSHGNQLVRKMQKYWANFARYGNPNGLNSGLKKWPNSRGKNNNQRKNVMSLNRSLSLVNYETEIEECNFLKQHGAFF